MEKKGGGEEKTKKGTFRNLVQVEFHARPASRRETVRSPQICTAWIALLHTHGARGKPRVATSCFNPFPPPSHVVLCKEAEMGFFGQLGHLLPLGRVYLPPRGQREAGDPVCPLQKGPGAPGGRLCPPQRGCCRFWVVLVGNLLRSCYKCN